MCLFGKSKGKGLNFGNMLMNKVNSGSPREASLFDPANAGVRKVGMLPMRPMGGMALMDGGDRSFLDRIF